jgi:hypothetical protein
MFELAHRQQTAELSDPRLPEAVRTFLIESELTTKSSRIL